MREASKGQARAKGIPAALHSGQGMSSIVLPPKRASQRQRNSRQLNRQPNRQPNRISLNKKTLVVSSPVSPSLSRSPVSYRWQQPRPAPAAGAVPPLPPSDHSCHRAHGHLGCCNAIHVHEPRQQAKHTTRGVATTCGMACNDVAGSSSYAVQPTQARRGRSKGAMGAAPR